jgi:hypothetical protein
MGLNRSMHPASKTGFTSTTEFISLSDGITTTFTTSFKWITGMNAYGHLDPASGEGIYGAGAGCCGCVSNFHVRRCCEFYHDNCYFFSLHISIGRQLLRYHSHPP